jgi:hypothetical protein
MRRAAPVVTATLLCLARPPARIRAPLRLKQYVPVRVDHSFRVGVNVHWWRRDLKSVPGCEALMAQSR